MKKQKNYAFKRYAPFIQEFIYKKGWNDLYEVQKEACEAILDTNSDVIIASGTASGKTEAVMFPILTQLQKKPSETISVLYIGPLKALINDQFKRLSELLENSDLPIWPWHGDISFSMKERAKRTNKGIIQITPESMEALLMRYPDIVSDLFSDLKFIIIDEIHALMGTDRGLQVISQIERIERLSKNRPRRIGLSATLGEYEQAQYFLSSGHPEKVKVLGLNSRPQSIGLRVESFLSPLNENNQNPSEALDYLFERTRYNKSLIFTNSRKEAESIIISLKEKAKEYKAPDIYHVHHSSLSASLKKETEEALKNSSNPIATAATLTLELGIDIGSLDQTIQIGAPFSCSNFVQRLGRSGRLTGKPLMRFINYYEEEDIKSPLDIPWNLLQSIAIIDLYLKEKWIEPFKIKKKPYSVLIHQTLSTLTAYSELKPDELARSILTLFPFKDSITIEEYKSILLQLIEDDYIQYLEDGSLIIGLNGEKLINHYSFYAVFADSEEYRVIYKGHEIGTLTEEPYIGEKFSLGGHSWRVFEVNSNTKTIQVELDHNAQAPRWSGPGIDIDDKIMQKIRQILEGDESYAFLSPEASELLEKTREYTKNSGILSGFIIDPTNDLVYIFPWCGTKIMRTLFRLLKTEFKRELWIQSIEVYNNFLTVKTSLSPKEFINRFKKLDFNEINPIELLEGLKNRKLDKFDDLLPKELWENSLIQNWLDLDGAQKTIKNFI